MRDEVELFLSTHTLILDRNGIIQKGTVSLSAVEKHLQFSIKRK
jgi:hypothetical protein